MTVDFPALAAQNAPLLQAIAERRATSLADLAERSGVRPDNMQRKVGSLVAAGLLFLPDPTDAYWQAEVTSEARRALVAIAVFHGELAVGAGTIPLDLIDPNPFQSRTMVDDHADLQLAQSIADKGVLQPIIVRRVGERYQQAFGHSRVRAAKLAIANGWLEDGWQMPAQVRELSDDDMLDLDLVENVQRTDLHWLDEAEAYLRHAQHGKSATDIKRLVGEGGRKKRSIQDYTKMARELDADAKRRARLPAGDPDHLTVEQCKFMVGERKPKPTFELSPKLALAMVELLDAGEAPELDGDPPAGLTVETPLHRKPVGGPLITLSDRGHVRFRFDKNQPVVLTPAGAELWAWLAARGFWTDRRACLEAAAEAALGQLAAGAAMAGGRYCTPELNPAEADDDAGSAERGAEAAAQGAEADGPDAEEDPPEFLRRLAGPGAVAAPPAAAAAIVLSPAHALAVTELAHKLQRHGQPRATGLAVAIGASWREDPLSNELIFERLLFMQAAGAETFAALTPTANTWLEGQGALVDGAPRVSDEALIYLQAEQGHALAGHYVTPWLNAAPAEQPPAAPADPTPQPAGPIGEAGDEAGAAAVAEAWTWRLAAEFWRDRAERCAAILTRLAAAGRQAEAMVQSAPSRKLKATDTTPVLKLIEGPLAEAEAFAKDPPPAAAIEGPIQ